MKTQYLAFFFSIILCFTLSLNSTAQTNKPAEVPALQAPPDITLHCNQNYKDLVVSGKPIAKSGLSAVASDDVVVQINSCGTGYVLRHFSATDAQGKMLHASQQITLHDPTPLVANFPNDWQTEAAKSQNELQPQHLPAGFGEPAINDRNCEQVQVSFEDEVEINPVEETIRILRHWLVEDVCVSQAGNNHTQGKYFYTQQIAAKLAMVSENESPSPFGDSAGTASSTGAEDGTNELLPEESERVPSNPAEFELYQNKPNPFKTGTVVGFYLPISSNIEFRIHTLNGQEVKEIKGWYEVGYQEIKFEEGDLPPFGVLLYTLEVGGERKTLRMVRIE